MNKKILTALSLSLLLTAASAAYAENLEENAQIGQSSSAESGGVDWSGQGVTASSGNDYAASYEGGQCVDVTLDPSWTYAQFSAINSGAAHLYTAEEGIRRGITVCVNAGHGTSGGESVRTQCHPDGTPKVTGGTNAEGSVTATSISSGMTFADGTAEASVTLQTALLLKEDLLSRGFDVLMIRDTDDVQLDNIARTVIANNTADCHIAIHFDSTENDKGAFYMAVPNIDSYLAMEPVASHYTEHTALGNALISGLSARGVKIFGSGSMESDLTQTSYSTIPSIDIELGDKVTDHSQETLAVFAAGLADGTELFFQ